MRKRLAFIALTFALPPALYAAFVVSTIVNRGYDWDVMDWNGDGRTQLREVIAAPDIITQQTIRGGRRCTHYFNYSRETLVRTDCESDA